MDVEAVTLGTSSIATIVLVLFLVGAGLLLVGMALTTVDVRDSHRAAHYHYKVDRVLSLGS